MRKIILILIIFYALHTNAQDKPIGYWESLLPYNTALGLATDGNTLYTICNQAFFTYNVSSGEVETYSKVNGMSDIGMQCISYDFTTSTVVLGYADGNIDLFKDNTFYNIPDFKLKNTSGVISINQIQTEYGTAYLSTSQGVIVIDLEQDKIIENYQLIINNTILPVSSFAVTDSYYYAATTFGLYRVYKDDPMIQVSSEWQNIDHTDSVISIVPLNNTLFFASDKKVFTLSNDTLQAVYTSKTKIQHIDPGYNFLFIGEGITTSGTIKRMGFNYTLFDSFDCKTPTAAAIELADSSVWFACPDSGLQKMTSLGETTYFIPDGPSSSYSFDLFVYNRNLWIAHGGYDEKFYAYGSYNGLSNYSNDKWMLYKRNLYKPLNSISDISSVIVDETNGTLYAGSYMDGLFTLHPDGYESVIDRDPPFDGSYAYGPGAHQVFSLALDKSDNLWASIMCAQNSYQLSVKTPDSVWYQLKVPGAALGGPLAIDDSGQVWMVGSQGTGLFVYNTHNTISDPSDDTSYHLLAGVGLGNLPSNQTNCIAKDLDNKIWIGTDNGIGIVSNCGPPFFHTPQCDAELPIVQYGQNPGYLFAGYNITSIAVDGANRKWIGTDDGLWLLSPDGSQVIYAFTTDNSPLPSNIIMKIAIDPVTGDVYIGTDQGLVSYRGTATDGVASYQNVLAFPNPVPSGYTGIIAIKGILDNADVRITDITGQLIYRTTALGGQAIWNGMDYTGRRPQSGVFLIFVSNSDGKQTYTGKIVFIQ